MKKEQLKRGKQIESEIEKMETMKTGDNYYSDGFDAKWIINNVYDKTVDITYINRPGSVFQKSKRLRRENKEEIQRLINAFFKLINV